MRTTTTTTSAGRFGRLVVLGLAATAGLTPLPAALSGAPAGAAGAAPIDAKISNFAFSPNPLTISVGETVRWTNDDGFAHTVTADDGSFDSGPTNGGATFSHTFSQAKTITYHCNIHPSMHGTIKVVADSTPTTAPAPTTTTTAAAPTTTTTLRATTTTTAPATTTTLAPAGGTAAPTTAATAPRATTTRPAAPSPTRPTTAASSAAPSTATQPPATAGPPPGPAGTQPPAEAAAPEPTPSTQVAGGVTTGPTGRGGARAAVWLGLVAALILGAAGAWAFLRRSTRRG